MNRRELANVALGGAAALAAANKASATLRPIPPGIKIGMSVNQPSPEYMSYLKQLGVTWVSVAPRAGNRECRGVHCPARAMGSGQASRSITSAAVWDRAAVCTTCPK